MSLHEWWTGWKPTRVARGPDKRPREASLDQLVARALHYAEDGDAPAFAVAKVLVEYRPDAEANAVLIEAGLGLRLNVALSERRSEALGDEEQNERYDPHTSPRWLARQIRHIDRQILLVGADGRMKSVLAFTLADCEALYAKAQNYVEGWTARRDAVAKAVDLLKTHPKANVVGELPAKALGEVIPMMAAAWQR